MHFTSSLFLSVFLFLIFPINTLRGAAERSPELREIDKLNKPEPAPDPAQSKEKGDSPESESKPGQAKGGESAKAGEGKSNSPLAEGKKAGPDSHGEGKSWKKGPDGDWLPIAQQPDGLAGEYKPGWDSKSETPPATWKPGWNGQGEKPGIAKGDPRNDGGHSDIDIAKQTPWGEIGKEGQPGGGGIGPQLPRPGESGSGDRPIDPKNLKKSSEKNPAFQFYTLGKSSAGMCQMTMLDTTEHSVNAGNKEPEWDNPCFGWTAAHCVEGRVDPTNEKGVFKANMQAPQLGDGPIQTKVYASAEYEPHLTAGSGFDPKDWVLVEFKKENCDNAKKNKVQRLRVCPSTTGTDGNMFAMSHQYDKQTTVVDEKVPFSNKNAEASVSVVPKSGGGPIIKKGDSGGPLVKAIREDGDSNPNNWLCTLGVLSTAPNDNSGTYAAHAKVRSAVRAKLAELKKGQTPDKDKKAFVEFRYEDEDYAEGRELAGSISNARSGHKF